MKKILGYMIYCYILLLPIAFVEPSPSDFIFIVIAILAFEQRIFNIKKFRRNKTVFRAILGFIALNIISILKAEDVFASIKYTIITVYLLVFAIIIFLYEPKKVFNRVLGLKGEGHETNDSKYMLIFNAYVVGSTVSAVLGIIGYLGIMSEWLTYDPYRTQGLFKDPNVFGPFLVPALVILIDDLKKKKVIRSKTYVHIFLLFINGLGILLSFSRSAWACALLAVGTYFILNIKKENLIKAIYGCVGLAVIMGLVWIIMPDGSFKSFIAERANLQLYDSERFSIQWVGIELGYDKLIGYGPGQYENIVRNTIGYEHSAHSLYVRTMLESGSLSLILLLIAIGNIIIRLFYAEKYCKKRLVVNYAVPFSIMVSLMVNSIVIDTIHWRHFWLFVGVSLSMLWDSKKRVKSDDNTSEVKVIGGDSLVRDYLYIGATEDTKGKDNMVAMSNKKQELMRERELEESLKILESALKDEINQEYSLRGGLR